MVIAIVVIVVAVALAARGRGGELSAERADYAPLDLGPVSATDVALLRPPTGMWGYNMQATDEAMDRIAESLRERDVRIVALEQLVTDLSREPAPAVPPGSPYFGARHRRGEGDRDAYGSAGEAGGYEPGAYGSSDYGPGGDPPGSCAPADDQTASLPPEQSHE